jgi:CheY-like chemotaxis protein
MARIHILVVDDLADAADIMVDLLAIWGYDAIACYCGQSALKSAGLQRPALVLLDLAMPGMDGFQFTRLFQELLGCKSVPIIAMTGYSSLTFRTLARELKIRHYLIKPADPDLLKDLLSNEIKIPISTGPLERIFAPLPHGLQRMI